MHKELPAETHSVTYKGRESLPVIFNHNRLSNETRALISFHIKHRINALDSTMCVNRPWSHLFRWQPIQPSKPPGIFNSVNPPLVPGNCFHHVAAGSLCMDGKEISLLSDTFHWQCETWAADFCRNTAKSFSGFFSNHFNNPVWILTITTGKGCYSSYPLNILPSNGRMLLSLRQNCSNITVVYFRITLA